MSHWEDSLENHQVWNELNGLEKSISAAQTEAEDAAADEGVHVKLDRLTEVVQHTRQVLNAADPRLVPGDTLETLKKQISAANGQVRNYVQNHNAGHLQSANSHADNTLMKLSQIWFPRSTAELQGLRKRLTSFRRSAGQLASNMKSDLRKVRQQAQQLQQQVEERLQAVDNRIEAQLGELETLVEEKRQQVEQKYSDQLEQLQETVKQHREEIQNQKQRLESAIGDFQQQFSEAQEIRRQSFADKQEERREAYAKFASQLEERMTNALDNAKSEIEAVLAEVTAVEKEVRESAEAIGAIGLTEAFKETADTERRAGRIWRGMAAASLFALIVAAFYIFQTTQPTPEASTVVPDWFSLTRKGLVTLSLLVLAGYAARQATRHFDNAQKHRQMQVELTSLGPYIATLDKSQQADIKDRLVDRWFGRKLEPSDSEGEREIEGATSAALRELKEILQEVRKGVLGDN